MKPLYEYPTPLTDKESYADPTPGHEVVSADFARDLERKLAKCRETLDMIENNSRIELNNWEKYPQYRNATNGYIAAMQAISHETLEQTK